MKQLFITSVRDFEKNTMGTVEMREMPMPEPAEDEVRIKIIYSSICGSDAHTLTGHLGEFEEGTKAMLPMTFGHELSGVIDKVGPKAEALGYHVGDKVIANYAKYCYACDNCRSGHENLCSHVQFCMNGFAEYAVYHVTQVHKLPENYDLETAALIEPLTIALAAAEQAHISYGKSVAIMGAGGIGLMLVQLARLAGASCVTVFDLVEEKCELAGGGLFSDGKLNFIHKLGKTDLTQFMPRSEAESLIEETEAIFDRFGMTAPVFPSDMENAKSIRKEAKKHGIDLLLIRQKHLGSDCLPNHIDGMCEALRERGVSIRTGEDARHVIVEDGEVRGLITDKGELRCRAAILAPGRVGADWMGDMAKKYGMELQQRGIEVGVRVETHNDVMSDLTNVIYDPTFFVQTQRYDDQTRTFCTNPAGFITLENYQDFVCVNGHAYRNRKSDNTNFAFLSKVILTDPVSDSHGYGVAIGRLASLIGGGKPILQRLGDLRRGRRSTWQRIHNGYVEPTLTEVTPGDIAMALPGRIVTNLVEGLEQLNLVVPGIADDSTLLYAPEIKFFSTQVATSSDLETSVSNLFVAGDGPGVSGNIVSAAATGIIPAKAIVRKFGKGEGKE